MRFFSLQTLLFVALIATLAELQRPVYGRPSNDGNHQAVTEINTAQAPLSQAGGLLQDHHSGDELPEENSSSSSSSSDTGPEHSPPESPESGEPVAETEQDESNTHLNKDQSEPTVDADHNENRQTATKADSEQNTNENSPKSDEANDLSTEANSGEPVANLLNEKGEESIEDSAQGKAVETNPIALDGQAEESISSSLPEVFTGELAASPLIEKADGPIEISADENTAESTPATSDELSNTSSDESSDESVASSSKNKAKYHKVGDSGPKVKAERLKVAPSTKQVKTESSSSTLLGKLQKSDFDQDSVASSSSSSAKSQQIYDEANSNSDTGKEINKQATEQNISLNEEEQTLMGDSSETTAVTEPISTTLATFVKPQLILQVEVIGNQIVGNEVDINAYLGKKAKALSFDFDLKLKLSCECDRCPLVLQCTDDCGTAVLNSKSKDPATFRRMLHANGNIRIRLEVLNQNEVNDKVNVETCHFFHSMNVGKSAFLSYLGTICGWTYLISWMVAFYPQVFTNFNTRSVVGLNLDFVGLNVTGYICYSVYNFCLFFGRSFQKQFFLQNPTKELPVKLNDVIFAGHGVFITSVMAVQCIFYERGGQRISTIGRYMMTAVYAPAAVLLYFFATGNVDKLMFISFFSFVKVGLAVFKYTPQVYSNYVRKSTKGWSIYYCYLDISGGVFSFLQIFLLAINTSDWSGLTANTGKLGLSLVSISYDLIFLFQYIIYRNQEDSIEFCDLKESTRGSITINNQCINQFSNLRPVQESPREVHGTQNRAYEE